MRKAIEANRPAQDLCAAPSRVRASTKIPAAERLDCLLPPSSNDRKVEKSTFSIEHYPRCDIFPGNKHCDSCLHGRSSNEDGRRCHDAELGTLRGVFEQTLRLLFAWAKLE